uniref:Uncharacterized protein n=1 Tax=Arundo donax TaxID=35708 RepID=A0A0A9A8T3_ARUDO
MHCMVGWWKIRLQLQHQHQHQLRPREKRVKVGTALPPIYSKVAKS